MVKVTPGRFTPERELSYTFYSGLCRAPGTVGTIWRRKKYPAFAGVRTSLSLMAAPTTLSQRLWQQCVVCKMRHF